MSSSRSYAVIAMVLTIAIAAAGCTRIDRRSELDDIRDAGPAAQLRLGFFPNVTHASALIGMDQGFFARSLGSTTVQPAQFNAGPNEVGALLGGSLDAAFIGTGPAINAYAKSDGQSVRLVAGATANGASLVVAKDITRADQLKGKTLVTPQLANTQDVAAKKWLAQQGLRDQVQLTNLDNPQTLAQFRKGAVQAAWVPEPWASRLVIEGGGHVLVDERDRWPGRSFPSTVLVVRTAYLRAHPQTVRALLEGELRTNQWAQQHPAAARASVNRQLAKMTGKPLPDKAIERAWRNIELTTDPMTDRFPTLAADQVVAEVQTTTPKVAGMAELTELNAVLAHNKRPAVSAAGIEDK